MSTLQLTKTKMQQGVWEGIVTQSVSGVPQVEVTHQGKVLDEVKLVQDPQEKRWILSVPVPRDAIADGVQTLLIRDKVAGDLIGHVTLLAGEDLGGDIRAEMDLLRAELDMLKRAFRRHCLETS
ncbi:hypothetical protein SAMN04488523_103152 [Sulfitobacter brevis]|uniref:Uncharacterized protein n=1 Tax=Sulfitobacter brevis TaxID=74348 RepID=A0A1I1VUK2_9RHOB|nr:hypothetical protein [Sulfitobacter brevis]SFD86746.1 hypothetical protein SAMN04488523_103152 [Sulfitobacter brevis]